MGKGAEFNPETMDVFEWEKFFKGLGVTVQFFDCRNLITAYNFGFEPGIYITTSPLNSENLSDEAYVEKLLDEMLNEAFYKIYGWEKYDEGKFPPNVFPDWIDYNEETKIFSVKLREENGEMILSMGSKNKLPL